MKYNLDVLNDKEFEDLCKDLLDTVYDVNFQIYKDGRDGGIDLMYAGKVENEIVVQVKHYHGSGYGQLKHKLINGEVESVKKMVPRPLRYVIATSVPLSPKQATEIKDLLSPFVRSTNDIFGRKRLESILSKNPRIEEKFFKLWLTSTNVMQRILNNAVINNSNFHREKILNNCKRYVFTDDFSHAINILIESKFLVISGLPGVGKTTLAYMLICERMGSGCELVFSDGKISEVEQILSHDPKKKQVFFIDDFLGANLFDIQNPKNPENKIISFVDKIRSSTNKYLIFTSRTTILNQASYRYENLNRSRLMTDLRYELELKNYTDLNKAKILYNHLYFNLLDNKFSQPFFQKDVYTRIIKHSSFFPRLIEFITDVHHYDSEKYSSVEEFVFQQLDHPEEIWKHAFQHQLEDEDRFLVMCLFSMGGTHITNNSLEVAFEVRYEYELANSGLTRKPAAYTNSLKKLLNGFFLSSYDTHELQNKYSFINPSIADYLLKFLREDKAEQKAILSSLAFIDQLHFYFGESGEKISIEKRLYSKIFKSIVESIEDLGCVKLGCRNLHILDAVIKYFPKQISADGTLAIYLLQEILINNADINSSILAKNIISGVILKDSELYTFIAENLYYFIDIIIKHATESADLENLTDIFTYYSSDFASYIETGENKYLIEAKLSGIFESFVVDVDFDEGEIVRRVSETGREYAEYKLEDDIWDEYNLFINQIRLEEYFDIFNHSFYVNVRNMVDNALDNISYDDDDRHFSGTFTNYDDQSKDEWLDIDRLFS